MAILWARHSGVCTRWHTMRLHDKKVFIKNLNSPFLTKLRHLSFTWQTAGAVLPASCWALPLFPTPVRPLQAVPHLVIQPLGRRVTSEQALPSDPRPQLGVAALSLGLPFDATPA